MAVTEHAAGADISAPTAQLMNKLGVLLLSKALYAQVEPLYRRALAIDEKSLGPDHPDVARAVNNLALLLKVANRLSEAEPLYRRALGILEQSLGADHPSTAMVRDNLSRLRS
jgi:tetratricopeptide (TPR) repeat protein